MRTRRRRPEALANYERRPLPALDRVPFKVLSRDELHDLLNEHIDELRARDCIYRKGKSRVVREDFAKNVQAVYDEFRKHAMKTKSGQGRTSWLRFARALYSDVETLEDALKKQTGVRRWTNALVVVGVLAEWGGETDEDGAWRCLRWRLESQPRRRSSVGRAPLS